MKLLNSLWRKIVELNETSFFWKQFFAWAPPLALVFAIDWFVTNYFNSINPETADTKRRAVLIMIGVISICLSILLRSWAKSEEKKLGKDDD